MSLTIIKSPKSSPLHIILFAANIVGFIRVAILLLLLITFMNDPQLSVNLYLISLVLDGVDGFLARRYNQVSSFGTILDMVTDRVMIALLLLVLCMLNQSMWSLFALFLLLDLSSHMAIIYSTAIEGKQTHKETLLKSHDLLRLYYENRIFLSVICASHDICFCAIYLYHFMPAKWLVIIIGLTFPGVITKSYLHIMQLYYAFKIVLVNQARQ